MTVAEEFSITVVLKEVNGFCEVIWSVSAEDVVEVSSVETVFDVSEVAVLVVESVEESVDVAEEVDSDEDEEVVV